MIADAGARWLLTRSSLMSALSHATHRTILLLSFATFSSMSVQRVCDAMLPELARVFSVSLAQAAQVISAFAVVYGVVQLLYGPLGDRLGKLRIVAFTTLACSLASLLSAFATSLDLLVLARGLSALFAAAIVPLSMAWVGDAVRFEHRQEALARVGLGTALGIVSGQVIGGVLTDLLGWRWAFVLIALMLTVVGLLLWQDLRLQPRPVLPEASPAHSQRTGFVQQAVQIVTGGWSRVVLAVGVIEGAAGFGVLALWATHLHQTHGITLGAAGAIAALFGLGGMIYMATARFLIPRLGERGLVQLGVSIVGLGSLAFAYAPVWQGAALASLLVGFGFFMFHNTMQLNATQMAPTARGTSVTLFASSLFLGQSLGVVAAAWLTERVGTAPVIALGGVALVLLGFAFAKALLKRDARSASFADSH
jgi:predicted MFS family arabinose efflux permease